MSTFRPPGNRDRSFRRHRAHV